MTVCAPARAAFLCGGGAAAAGAAALSGEVAVALFVVLLVLAGAGVAWFAILMREPVWRPPGRRARRAIPSYRAAAEKPPAAISAPHRLHPVIDGTGLVVREQVPRQRDGEGR
jgi:hypothetical protein